ncbi:MAG: ABC transporter ATP-binding protein, partial [Rhodospirillaceae bacterium]|nr:ABC transporter ATP-binding protein [Rhodospirillaceae bacterium]
MKLTGRPRPVIDQSNRGAAPLLSVDGLKRHFDVSAPFLNRVFERLDRSYVKAVDGISFDIGRGETFSLVGESGCGKSTVARLIVGLYQPTGGSIQYEGVEIGPREAAA